MKSAADENQDYIASLDWVRAMAALSVLAHHITPLVAGHSLLPRAYLSVDLFFLLSGFVVAKRYEPRLGVGLNPRSFIAARAYRLMPLLLLAGAISTLEVLMRSAFGTSLADTPSWKIFFASLASYVALPSASAVALGYGNWPLNPPLWSLFFELLVGVLVAPWLLRARSTVLVYTAAAAAFWLARHAWTTGNLDAGALLEDFYTASARMTFSFCLGILLFRQVTNGPAAYVLPIAFLFGVITVLGLLLIDGFHGLTDLFVVMLLWPAVLASLIAPGSPLTLPRASWLGETSYATYVLHWPLIVLLRNVAHRTHLVVNDDWLSTFILATAVTILSAAAVLLYERPLRLRLRQMVARNLSNRGSISPNGLDAPGV